MQVSVSQVIDVLGGKKNVNFNIKNHLDFIGATEKGFPINLAQNVQKRLDLSNKQFGKLLNISESTFQRRLKNNEKLSADEGEKLIEISTIIAKGIEVFGDTADFQIWLNTPILALGNKKPILFLNSSIGREEILDILFRIEHGIYS